MKGWLLIAAAAFAVLAGTVQAHTHLKSSMPAESAVLAKPPTELMLHFNEVTRLTALSIQKQGEKDASPVSPLPKAAAQELRIPLAPVAPGHYTVTWRAVGDDNHVMSGALHFTVSAP